MRGFGRAMRLMVGVTLISLLGACASSASSSPRPASPTPAATSGLTPSPSPAATLPRARTYGVMVSLGADGGVLLLEGVTAPPPPWGSGAYLQDVWRYSSQGGWKLAAVEPTPHDFVYGSAVFDAGGDRVIVAAATYDYPPFAYNLFYDPKADRWQAEASPSGPAVINGAPIVYDSKADRVMLFGGESLANQCNDQTWVYDLASDTWTLETPKVRPPAGNYGKMVYDEKAGRAIMYAVDCDGYYAGTWAYDLGSNSWTDLKPATSPPSRVYGAMAYDPTADKIILFGGVDEGNGEQPVGDTWAYSLASNSWTQLSPAVAPSARGWAAMAYEAGSGKLVLFGGGTRRDAPLADTWLFDAATDVWTQAQP